MNTVQDYNQSFGIGRTRNILLFSNLSRSVILPSLTAFWTSSLNCLVFSTGFRLTCWIKLPGCMPADAAGESGSTAVTITPLRSS